MQALALTLLLMQSQITMHPENWAAQQKLLWELQTRQMRSRGEERILAQQQARQQAALEEYFFAQKMNKFITKLTDFITIYNAGSVDMKKLKDVKKAWADLEKTDGWFQRTQGKGPSDKELQAVSGEPN